MSDYVFFHMWEGVRISLISKHSFYVEQARERLLSRFEDIEGETNAFADKWLKDNNSHFDPDRHDPADFYERANENAIEFYGLLSDMRDATRLSVISGMFHEWEKQLRDWLAREIAHWHAGEHLKARVWRANFDEIIDLLEHFGWKVKGEDFYSSLDRCRLVVNVYKHGEGGSFDRLKNEYPEFFEAIFGHADDEEELWRFVDFSHLQVNDDHVDEFSDAIISFLKGIPREISTSQNPQVPDWFDKAAAKDRKDKGT